MKSKHTITTKHFHSLAYNSQGQGPALVLLHGFPASGNLWDEIVEGLSEKYTVLVPDIPGSGESVLDGEATSMEELATIVPAILDDSGFGTCVLAGHSMGGYIALTVAELFPSRLSGLALIHSTAAADDEAKKDKRRKSISLIRKGGKKEFIRGMIPALFSEAYKTTQADKVQERIQDGLKLPDASIIAFYNAMIQRPARLALLQRVSFPMQWVLGKEDSLIPWQSCMQQCTLPGVSYVILYESCGHMSMIEHPERLLRDLLSFSDYCVKRSGEAKGT